jgi:acyl-CoA synthetase (AMP-forming)/AMP-acid ligase II
VTATLTELLHESARTWPERVAVSDGVDERAITYRNLGGLVGDLAAALNWHGVGRGDPVAIVSDNCVEYVLALFAVVASGACAAPLNPQLAAGEIPSRLGQVGARAVIVPAHLYDDFAGLRDHGTSPVWKLALTQGSQGKERQLTAELIGEPLSNHGAGPAKTGEVSQSRADDVALLLLTSGTTAAPKVVPLTHAGLLASINGIRGIYRLTPQDATLLVMPLFHGHGLIAGLLATLASGGTGVMPAGGRFHAGRFWPEMIAAQATWYTAVPTIHQILLARAGSDYPDDGYPNLRFVRSCSAPLASGVLRDLEAAFSAPVLEAYGMTETAHQVASNPLPADGPDKPGSVGIETGVEIRVTRADGKPAVAGETGEIWIRGAAVTSGYLGDARATADSFTGGWFHSGDLGYTDADGYLFLTGRIKEIIDRGGEKISPAAVDKVLQSNASVEDALSFPVPDEKYGEEIYAAVVLRPGQSLSEGELKDYSRARLSAFEVPKRIFFLASLPRTEKGADDRRQLTARFGTGTKSPGPRDAESPTSM